MNPLEMFIAAMSEARYPPIHTESATSAWWNYSPFAKTLEEAIEVPGDVAIKAANLVGCEYKVRIPPHVKGHAKYLGQRLYLTHASLRNRGCGCSPKDKLAVLVLELEPRELAKQ